MAGIMDKDEIIIYKSEENGRVASSDREKNRPVKTCKTEVDTIVEKNNHEEKQSLHICPVTICKHEDMTLVPNSSTAKEDVADIYSCEEKGSLAREDEKSLLGCKLDEKTCIISLNVSFTL